MKKIKGYVSITLALLFITMLLRGVPSLAAPPQITLRHTPLPTALAAR